MKILLINIDSVLPNIALKKIEKYHINKGNEIIWDFPLMKYNCDKVYVSCIFTKNRALCNEWEGEADIGGTGYNIKKKLPKEIEDIKLKINYGFTTRGCIRKCDFCFVPEKEGNIHIVGDLYDLWDGYAKKIIILDNNILVLPEHFIKICKQARENNLELDFNQGLDIRLFTDALAKELTITKTSDYRFAFDDYSMKSIIEKKMPILHKYKISAMWYILVGYNSTIKDDIKRVEYLVRNKQRPYIMKHEKCNGDKRYIALARWANSPLFGKGTIPFNEYLNDTDDGKNYKKYFKDYNKST